MSAVTTETRCAALDCRRDRAHILFCAKHWQRLHRVLQTAVWRSAPRKGQASTARYLVIQSMAVATVAHSEHRIDAMTTNRLVMDQVRAVGPSLTREDHDYITQVGAEYHDAQNHRRIA